MKEQLYKWHTNYLSREFEMLVFGHGGIPVILFPTSMGRYYEYKDFNLIESAAGLIDAGIVKVYCPDGIDSESWYNKSIHPADRVRTHMGYENVILNDVIECSLRETGRARAAVGGCSFGGYHAANVAFRHPDKVGFLISMSASFDIKQFLQGYYDDNCYFNNPPDYLPNLTDPRILDSIRTMGIVLGTGEWDMCLPDNRRLSGILEQKGIAHWLDVRKDAGHDWPWWKEMFPRYLARMSEAAS